MASAGRFDRTRCEDCDRLRRELTKVKRELDDLRSAVIVEELERSGVFGTLGDAIRSLNSLPADIKEAHLRLVKNTDDWDNASKVYGCRGDPGTVLKVSCSRSFRLLKFGHDCQVTLYRIRLRTGL